MAAEGRHSRIDRLLAWGAGVAVGFLAWFSGNSLEIPPELWDEISVAASLRPPCFPFPLQWQGLLSFFIGEFGISPCLSALKILGPVSLALLTVLACRLFSGLLPISVGLGARDSLAGKWIGRVLVLQAAVLLVCSEPVWLAGRVFSPEMMMFILTAAAFVLCRSAKDGRSPLSLIAASALSGALFAETPFAIFPCLLSGIVFYRRCCSLDEAPAPFASPLVFVSTMRRMTFAFFFFWIAAVAVNIAFYRERGGGGQTDAGVFAVVGEYLFHYFTAMRASMSPMGILLVLAVAVIPAVLISAKVRDLTDENRLLPMPYAFMVAVGGVFAMMQSTGLHGWRFWDWEPGAVNSRYVLCLSMLAVCATGLHASGVFAVDVFLRNHMDVLREMFPEAADGRIITEKSLRSFCLTARLLRWPLTLAPVAVLLAVIPFKFDSSVREMSSIVNAIAAQTAAECAGAEIVITDGSYDAAVETASALGGSRVKAMSMMSCGTADTLRQWVKSGDCRATNIAVQVGFELWRNLGLPVPPVGGLTARTCAFPGGDAGRWADKARILSERSIGFCESNDLQKCGYPELRKMFHFGQWRLSRMCRMRAEEADAKNDAPKVEQEHSLADRIDAVNPKWKEVRDKMHSLRWRGSVRFSPRDSLKASLEKADFRTARPFAEKILVSDPGDPQANFAVAMGYFIEKRYVMAEKHLKTYLDRRPGEPAVLNNLAVVQLRLGKIDEAETNALKALERLGDSPEVKATLRHIRAAKDNLKSN